MIYPAVCQNCGEVEISQSMTAAFPRRHAACGGTLRRRYVAPAIHYAAPGFYSADTDRLKQQVSPERFARFEKFKASAEARAKAGRLTPYEKALENA